MRVKKNRDTLEQSYSLYLKDTLNPVSKKVYKEVIYTFNKEVARLIVEEGLLWKLPNRLGYLGVFRKKMKFHKPKFDFQHWKETGEHSYHLNEHSKEWYAFCNWRKKRTRLKRSYKFTLSRDNKRAVAQQMKLEDGYMIYQVIEYKKRKKKWNSD